MFLHGTRFLHDGQCWHCGVHVNFSFPITCFSVSTNLGGSPEKLYAYRATGANTYAIPPWQNRMVKDRMGVAVWERRRRVVGCLEGYIRLASDAAHYHIAPGLR